MTDLLTCILDAGVAMNGGLLDIINIYRPPSLTKAIWDQF